MNKTARTVLLLFPVCLSLLILAAHFVRSGSLIATAICVFLMFGLFMFKAPSARLVQIALFMGTIEWISTAVALAAQRSAMGTESTRMLVILLSVAAVCFLSIFVFFTRTLKERFELDKEGTIKDDDPEVERPSDG